MSIFHLRPLAATALAMATAAILSGCNSTGSDSSGLPVNNTTVGSVSPVPPPSGPVPRSYSTDFMIFTGNGTWSAEISDAEALFTANGASFEEVNDAQLDAMTAQDLAKFGVLYIPGGEGGTEAQGVTAGTHENLRTAVQTLGVGYVGICAGAFVAVAPAPAAGQDVSYGFGVVNGALINEYAGPGTTADYEQTLDTFADGSAQDVLWYGGPVTPNTGVIAKYPTGEPAISQMWSGNGMVILSGVHADLSQATLQSLGVSPPTSVAQTIGWKIFNAVLTQTPLATF